MKKYPLKRAIMLANKISLEFSEKYPELLNDTKFHDSDFLIGWCKELGIRIIDSKSIPGEKRPAAIIDVEGNPFII
ncbi:MAG: hypothetical protein AB1746_05600, partial [Candidatus Zixiibacteriota bacterium]